jgi:hypothetical protein
MSTEDIFDDDSIEVELTDVAKTTGRELIRRRTHLTADEALEIPEKITIPWVRSQLDKSVWAYKKAMTPATIVRMHADVKKGLPRTAVCARAGISPYTWAYWVGEANQGIEPYATWHRLMLHAAGDLQAELIDNIRDAADEGDWKAASWLLSKVNKEDFGNSSSSSGTTNINVSGDVNTTRADDMHSLTDENAARLARIMGKIGALGPAPVTDAEVVDDDS